MSRDKLPTCSENTHHMFLHKSHNFSPSEFVAWSTLYVVSPPQDSPVRYFQPLGQWARRVGYSFVPFGVTHMTDGDYHGLRCFWLGILVFVQPQREVWGQLWLILAWVWKFGIWYVVGPTYKCSCFVVVTFFNVSVYQISKRWKCLTKIYVIHPNSQLSNLLNNLF